LFIHALYFFKILYSVILSGYHKTMNKKIENKAQHIDSSTMSMVKRLVRNYLRPYTRTLIWALCFMVLSALMTALFAKMIEPILDKVLVAQNGSLVVPMGLAVFSIFLVNGVSGYIYTVLMNKIGQSIVADIQRDLFSSFINLDLRFFQDNPSGQLVSRVVNDVQVVRAAVTSGLTGIGKNLITLLFLVGLMFWQDWKLALIAICIFPPAGLFVSWVGKRLRKLSGNVQMELGQLTDTLTQIFQGIRQVKAYGMERFERQRSGYVIERVKKLVIKSVRVGTLSTPFNEMLIGLALAGIVIYGGTQVVNGNLTIGALMSFIAAFTLAYEPVKRLAKLNNTLQTGLGAAERIFDMLDKQPSIQDKADAVVLDVKKPEIKFDKVVFGYEGDDNETVNALDNVSFKVSAGKVTALVGASGSGKTTAMNMVPRFYDVQGGQVTVGGHDIKDVTMQSLRNHIALVSQDITIFDDSVQANIAYGRPDATHDEIEEAAKNAAAHEFIQQLPQAYATRLGEDGTKLSGGQKQRIAIARAMLKDAPILLLDEATSALDNESERAIQASLEVLQKGRTTLVIAHRLSTVQGADQIIVLDKGKVVEKGKHDALMKKNGVYARMYNAGLDE
jgi:subfamily B ATP-binding cassette protein MsbA